MDQIRRVPPPTVVSGIVSVVKPPSAFPRLAGTSAHSGPRSCRRQHSCPDCCRRCPPKHTVDRSGRGKEPSISPAWHRSRSCRVVASVRCATLCWNQNVLDEPRRAPATAIRLATSAHPQSRTQLALQSRRVCSQGLLTLSMELVDQLTFERQPYGSDDLPGTSRGPHGMPCTEQTARQETLRCPKNMP
jgi:hypothetical protein